MFACYCDDEILILRFCYTYVYGYVFSLFVDDGFSWRSTITVVTVTFSFLFDDDAFLIAVEFLFMVI